jgi:hypothetical protein
MQRIVGFSVVPEGAQARVIQSFSDHYKASIQTLLDDFEKYRRYKEGLWVKLYGAHLPDGIIRGEWVSVVVEHSIMSRVVERLMDVEDRLQELVSGTLSERYALYRELSEELEALRSVRDLYTRPKPRDPKFVYKELKLWEGTRRVLKRSLTELSKDVRVDDDLGRKPFFSAGVKKIPMRPRGRYEVTIM